MIREQVKWSQTDFANEVGITRPKLVSIEYGHTPLRYGLAVVISRVFDIRTKWLATGKGEMRPYVPLLWTVADRENFSEDDLLTRVYDFMPSNFEPYRYKKMPKAMVPSDFDFRRAVLSNASNYLALLDFRDHFSAWAFTMEASKVLRQLIHNYVSKGKAVHPNRPASSATTTKLHFPLYKDLTDSTTSLKLPDMKRQLPSLRERLNRATKETGKMSALAEFLSKATRKKVPLASVSRWLSGKREPGGEITLKMLHWVEQQERQK